jgi:putative mRNA 3-end processing factor
VKLALIVPTAKGIYVPAGDFYIDPVKPVPRAMITHAHSDHARRGHGAYLCTEGTAPLLRARLGQIPIQTLPWSKQLTVGEVCISFHPAGHMLGSAQIRIVYKGYVFLVTGDFKREADPTAEAWEPVKAHAVLSECTFGLPIYQWPKSDFVLDAIKHWWIACQRQGRHAVLLAYSLGKAQRLLASLPAMGPRYVHPAIAKGCRAYNSLGVFLGPWRPLPKEGPLTPGSLILWPPQAETAPLNSLGPYEVGQASGWFLLRRHRRTFQGQAFVLSDHADFPQLVDSLLATEAETFYFTHGYTEAMQALFTAKGYESYIWGDATPTFMGS